MNYETRSSSPALVNSELGQRVHFFRRSNLGDARAEKETSRPGDAFYMPKGREHRGYATTEETVRLITVYYPVKY